MCSPPKCPSEKRLTRYEEEDDAEADVFSNSVHHVGEGDNEHKNDTDGCCEDPR